MYLLALLFCCIHLFVVGKSTARVASIIAMKEIHRTWASFTFIVLQLKKSRISSVISQKAVVSGNKGEPVEGVVGAVAGVELRGAAHRVGDQFSGELWINMLSVGWAFLNGESMKYKSTFFFHTECIG